MKDTPKHNFEEEFRKAFEDAEATPSPKLWAQIDADLANKEAGIYKRKLYIYKLRVAAAAVLAIGFLGIWLISSQYTGDTLAGLPGQTTTPQPFQVATDSAGKRGNPANPAKDTNTGASELARQAPAEKQQPAPETADRPAGENVLTTENALANENSGKIQKSRSHTPDDSGKRASLSAEKVSAGMPERIALEKNREKNNTPSNNSQEKATTTIVPATTLATIQHSSKKEAVKQESSVARMAPTTSTGGQRLAVEENTSTRLPGSTTTSEVSNPATSAPLASRTTTGQQEQTPGTFSAYAFRRINQQVQPLDNTIALQAPAVRVKPNNNVWIEDEKEIEGGRSTSRWALGVAFTPSQFDPNMQVNSQASASLSNARNNYYFYGRNAAPVSTGNTLQSNASVGKELEKAQNINLSYNIGVDVGYALSEKFSLHSGLLYLHNSSQITTDNYLQNISNQEKYPEFMALIQPASTQNSLSYSNLPAPLNAPNMADGFQNLELAIADKYATSYPGVTEVTVYNTYQYLSIPMSLHYKLLDKKVSTDIGAGVSADLFMKNTIGNPEENITGREFTRSDSGPYRDISFSGLLSAKVNYRISSKYSVYIQPSYRTALNSVTNSALVSSRPNAFGIGTGFQYRF